MAKAAGIDESEPGAWRYRPAGVTVREFLLSTAFVRGIRGPLGSGKSVACCIEIMRKARQQKPAPDGWRRSRIAVIRNHYPELRSTTMRTWLDWFPPEVYGPIRWVVPYSHRIVLLDEKVELEVLFIALDRPEHVRKLLSLELSGAWINEAREVPKAILDGLTGRVGRFPSKRRGGCANPYIIMDTNSPDEEHWWPIMSGEARMPDWVTAEEALTLVKPKGWQFFAQPPALLDVMKNGKLVGYKVNPKAENLDGLDDGVAYYTRTMEGKNRRWIQIYLQNQLGAVMDGEKVIQNFDREKHVAKDPLPIDPRAEFIFGQDFGMTGAILLAQRTSSGRILILRELLAFNRGTLTQARRLKRAVYDLRRRAGGDVSDARAWAARVPDCYGHGDPAGSQRAQTDERTPFQIMRAMGFAIQPGPVQDIEMRIETVEEALSAFIEGQPLVEIDPSCKTLIAALEGRYQYERKVGQDGQLKDMPKKDRFSAPADALQYLLTGEGVAMERVLMRRTDRPTTGVARNDGYSVWERQRGRARRGPANDNQPRLRRKTWGLSRSA